MTRVWLDEPVDEVHAMSIECIVDIRRLANDARRRLGLAPRCYEQHPHVHKKETP
jgi:hypothetical protein